MESALLDTYEQLPFEITSGDGVWVTSSDGSKYLDMYGGHAVCLLGHNPPALISAMEEQARSLFFYSNIAPIALRETAGAKLASIAPSGFAHIFFCNSGAEANDNALKLAIRLTGRAHLVSYKGSFHGRSLLATAVTDAPVTHKELNEWVGERVTFLTPNSFEELDRITNETAAVILEPIQSIAGVTTFEVEYLTALRDRCTQMGAFLIFDEVQTGMGRTGKPFVSGFCGVVPDMFTTAKGIASGYPVGALFVCDSIAGRVKQGDLGATYGGGPLAMAIVSATIDELVKKDLFQNAIKIEKWVKKYCSVSGVQEIRGRGCLLGLKTTMPAKEVVRKLLDEKIISGTCKDPQVVRFLPPVILEEADVQIVGRALEKILMS